MSETKTPRNRRRTYVVNPRLQFVVAAKLVAVLVGVGILYVIALFVLPGEAGLAQMGAQEVRDTLLRANAIYFALGAAILVVVSLILTHRIAGPVLVLTRAIRAIRKGDYSRPIFLRERDFLKTLAAEFEQHRCELIEAERERKQLLEELERCVGEDGSDAARDVIRRLKAEDADSSKEQPVGSA